MKTALILIPVVLGVGLFLSKKIQDVGQDIILPEINILERIDYHAKAWGLDVALVKAIAKVESNFNPRARNFEKSPENYDDSIGLMQITPALAYDSGLIKNYKNPTVTEIEWMFEINNNLNVACEFLNHLRHYEFEQMVMSYNVGEQGYFSGRRNFDYFSKVRGYYESYNLC